MKSYTNIMDSEKIVLLKRLGYFKLFNDAGELENEKYVWVDGAEWKQLFWRFYWWM